MSEGPFDSLAFAQGILHGLACHERSWRLAKGGGQASRMAEREGFEP